MSVTSKIADSAIISTNHIIASTPKDVWNVVLSFLEFGELSAVSAVCKKLHIIARDCQTDSLKRFIAEKVSLPIRFGYVSSVEFPANVLIEKVVKVVNGINQRLLPTPYELSSYNEVQILAIQHNIKTACEEEKASPNVILNDKFKRNSALQTLISDIRNKFEKSTDHWHLRETK